LVQELLEQGAPEFVERLRAFSDPDVFWPFARRCYSNLKMARPDVGDRLLARLDALERNDPKP
jgi:hypothetical protein